MDAEDVSQALGWIRCNDQDGLRATTTSYVVLPKYTAAIEKERLPNGTRVGPYMQDFLADGSGGRRRP